MDSEYDREEKANLIKDNLVADIWLKENTHLGKNLQKQKKTGRLKMVTESNDLLCTTDTSHAS